MVRVNPLAQYQRAAYNAPRGGVSFMAPAGMAPRRALPRRAAPIAARQAAAGMSLADRIRANEDVFQQNAMVPAEEDGGFKQDAIHGLGWIVGNPVSRAILKPLEVLDYPRAAAVGTIRQLLETEALEDFNKTLANVTGLKYTPLAKPEGNEEGFQWSEMWRDTKKHEGFGTSIIEPQFEDANIWVKRGLGFAGDIGSDPLAWLSSGTRAASGLQSRFTYLNKLQDAQNAAKGEAAAAREAAEFAAEHALLGGTGADAATAATREAAELAQNRIDELSMIGDRQAMDVMRKRGVAMGTPTQLEAMGVPQHAVRLSGVPIQDVFAGPVRMLNREAGDALAARIGRPSEAASRAMSRFLSPGKELWSQTAGRQTRKIVTPRGVIKQTLGPATERLVSDQGTDTVEEALRAYRLNETMRLAQGDFKAPSDAFLGQLHERLKGVSDEDQAAMIKAAEELGEANDLTTMPENIIAVMKSMGLDPPELKPWTLPNGQQSRYVMPHVLSRDSFRFFNRLRKGQNPMIDFIRRDLGIHDKDLLEEGGFLQRRLFRPNADGSPQTFKIGEDEIEIVTGSLDELEEKLGGLLRKHGFQGKLYEQRPMEAWRRYINATKTDVAKRVAEIESTGFGMAEARYKGAVPKSYDPYGRDLPIVPAEGETEPRYVRGKSTERAPVGDDVWEYVDDPEATKARNEIITKGGEKNVHAQVAGEYADTATATRENLARGIEGTRQNAEAAFDTARAKSAKTLRRAEGHVARTRAKVDKLEGEYLELIREASANQEIIAANRGSIHGIRSQTPKKIKAAIQARLNEVARQLEHERGRLDSLEAGLKHALEGREQREADELLERFVGLQDRMMQGENDLEAMRGRARKAVANRLKRETKDRPEGYDHLVTEDELAEATFVLDAGADSQTAKNAAQLQTRLRSVAEEAQYRRNAGLELEQQAARIEEQLGRKTGGTAPRTAGRQARMEAADKGLAAQARKLRDQSVGEHRRANELDKELVRIKRWIKQDPWNQAQEVIAKHTEQQNQIDNFLNPSAGIDVRAEQIKLNKARRELADFLQERKAASVPPPPTPLQRSEARLAEAVGQKPDIEHTLYPGDDAPGGHGLHQVIVSEPGVDISAWQPATDGSGTPGYISSLLWDAETGEVMWANTTEALQRKGVGTSTFDYATKLAEEQGFTPPVHSLDQTDAGAAWAPEADERIARWAREDNTLRGLESNEAKDARAVLDSPEAVDYAADETLLYGLQYQINRIENPPEGLGFVEWTEVGRPKPAKLPRKNQVWQTHNSRRRSLAGEMESVRGEADFTAPPTDKQLRTESYRRPKPRPRGANEPAWLEGYRAKPSTRRLRGKEPWWTEEYPSRPDLTSTKASRTRRLKALQKEIDKEDAWLAKNPEPPHPRPNPRGHRFRAKISGKVVRLERGPNERVWRIKIPGQQDQTFNGTLPKAWEAAEDAAKKLTKVEPDQALLADLKQRLAAVENRMKNARTAKSDVPELLDRNPWEQPFQPEWWRNSKDVFGEELGQVAEEGSSVWNAVENMYTTSDDDLELLVAEHWNKLTPEGRQRMEELGWDGGLSPGNAGEEIAGRVKGAREALHKAAFEQGSLPEELTMPPKPPPNPEDFIHERFDSKIADAYRRVREQGAKGNPRELEAIRAGIQGPADERIAGLQNANESLQFQNERLGEMVNDLYGTRMPDPVNDWRHALNNADQARQVHQRIVDNIERYSVRQRAIDIVEKNRRAGAPTIKDLEAVAERRMRPEDAQGLMKAVDDVKGFISNAGDVLPVKTRKQIEAALMAHEQALATLTTTNDLPAKALNDMQKAANSGDLPKVLKAQLRDVWREVGQDGDIIISKRLQRMWFGAEEVLDSKLFGPLFTTWTNFFKTYATLTPGFHVRNAISAILMNATEGVGPRAQMRAVRLWKRYMAAENPLTFLAGLPEAERNAFRATFASGASGQFLEAGVGTARAGASRAKERLFANPATRLSKNLGTWVEGPQRLALGLHTTMNGGSVGDALNRITRIHFDYAQVSKFDETMKRIIPFWTFMSRNIPLQFTQMWMKPSVYLRYQSFARNMALGNEGDTILPSYIEQAGGMDTGLKTPGWAEKIPLIGPPKGMPIVLQPDLPHARYADDLQRLTNALSGGGIGQMATNLNPLLTVPGEFASRTDFFTGQRFDPEDSVQVGGAATPWAMALSAIGQARKGADGKWYIDAAAMNAIRGLDPNLDRMMRLLPQAGGLETTDKTGASTTARQAESWARYMGLPVRTITPQQQRSEVRNQFFKERERRLEKLNSGG